MRASGLITDIICGGAVLYFGFWLAVEHQARLSVDREHTVLARQLQQRSLLVARDHRSTDLVGRANGARPAPEEPSPELLRLRGEVGVLREQCKELVNVRAENRQAHAMLESSRAAPAGGAATADYWPRDSWSFTGYGSPDAALQTSLWAANNGDVKTLLASTTGELRQLIEADLGGKSAEEASIKAMDEVFSFNAVRVLNREAQANDTAVLTIAIEGRTQTQTVKLLMKRIGNEWKISGKPD